MKYVVCRSTLHTLGCSRTHLNMTSNHSHTTLAVTSGSSLKELCESIMHPNHAKRVQAFCPATEIDNWAIQIITLRTTPDDSRIGWNGIFIEKNLDLPATRSIGRWRTTSKGTMPLRLDDTFAEGSLIVEKRGFLQGIYRDPRTKNITFVYSGADVHLQPSRQISFQIRPRKILF